MWDVIWIGWSCMRLEVVKSGRGCRHFSASSDSFSGRYGNFCVRVSRLGRVVIMNEYISFCILSSGLVMCGLSKWNFFSTCGSVGSGVGLLIILFKRVIVH
jgi:hypothetical protein